MKASDIKELKDSVDYYVQGATKKGPSEVLRIMEENVKKLHRVRGESGRGAKTNIPIWKAIAAAIFIGVGLWAIFKCGIFGCSIAENLSYGIIMLIAAVVVWFC